MNDLDLNRISTLAQDVTSIPVSPIKYSFGTLVTNPRMYEDMISSFRAVGFGEDDCEFLYVNNTSGNVGDGYRGLNRVISAARGKFVVLCHQDVLAIDNRRKLDACLAELDGIDPSWAVVGNAGFDEKGARYMRITDWCRTDVRFGTLPGRVVCLDENLLILKRDGLAGFSSDLSGFHLYGTDLVVQAGLRGGSAYVVDYHLNHLGAGKDSPEYWQCFVAFHEKYTRAIRPQVIQLPLRLEIGVGRHTVDTWIWTNKLRRPAVWNARPVRLLRLAAQPLLRLRMKVGQRFGRTRSG